MDPVRFSDEWRETFGRVDPERTATEVAFCARVLPLPSFARLLDVPCGTGRHMRGLAELGYEVTGVDSDEAVVAQARSAGLHAELGDLRRLDGLPTDFDAVVCMWASFGYFGEATNADVLRQFADRLRPGGRLVVDVYHRRFFERHQGETRNRGVIERRRVRAGRLRTELVYADGERDVFEWQLFAPGELAALAGRYALVLLVECSEFDEETPPDSGRPRMQLVFERSTSERRRS